MKSASKFFKKFLVKILLFIILLTYLFRKNFLYGGHPHGGSLPGPIIVMSDKVTRNDKVCHLYKNDKALWPLFGMGNGNYTVSFVLPGDYFYVDSEDKGEILPPLKSIEDDKLDYWHGF